MEYLHEPEPDFLDLDKPGYYFPEGCELFLGMRYELKVNGKWTEQEFDNEEPLGDNFHPDYLRVRFLQAKDILSLGFGRVQVGMPMYLRGTHSIVANRLFDPSFAKITISNHGVTIWQGKCKNASELKRILILNEINFADN